MIYSMNLKPYLHRSNLLHLLRLKNSWIPLTLADKNGLPIIAASQLHKELTHLTLNDEISLSKRYYESKHSTISFLWKKSLCKLIRRVTYVLKLHFTITSKELYWSYRESENFFRPIRLMVSCNWEPYWINRASEKKEFPTP